MVERSSFVTTRSGTWNPVAMNSVRGMGPFLARNRRREKISPATCQSKGVHGSHGHACAVRRRARGAAPARRPAQGPGRGDPPGRRIPAPAHVRGGDGAERAVRLERAHRLERCGQAGIAGVRRAGAGDPDASGLLRGDGLLDGRTVGRKGDMMTRLLVLLGCLTLPSTLFPLPALAQKRAITIDDYLALKAVGDPQLSPDGRWVAYTVTEYSLKDNRGAARIWLADVATGQAREVTAGPGSDRQPRWSPDGKTLAFIATRQNGPQLWLLPIGGGEARRVTDLADGVSDPVWPPDGKEIAVALHGDSTVADNTNVDIYLAAPDGSAMRALTTSRGADNTPRYSPDGRWLAYVSMERAGFEADRQRLMLVGRKDGKTESGNVTEATAGWTLSVGSYTWCPDAKCLYAVVEERGRANIYRIDVPTFRHSIVATGGGVNTNVQVMPDGKGVVYLHQSNTQPAEVWASGRPLTHHDDGAVARLDLPPLEPFGFVGAL